MDSDQCRFRWISDQQKKSYRQIFQVGVINLAEMVKGELHRLYDLAYRSTRFVSIKTNLHGPDLPDPSLLMRLNDACTITPVTYKVIMIGNGVCQ